MVRRNIAGPRSQRCPTGGLRLGGKGAIEEETVRDQ